MIKRIVIEVQEETFDALTKLARSDRPVEQIAGEMLDRHLAYQLEVARMRPPVEFTLNPPSVTGF